MTWRDLWTAHTIVTVVEEDRPTRIIRSFRVIGQKRIRSPSANESGQRSHGGIADAGLIEHQGQRLPPVTRIFTSPMGIVLVPTFRRHE